MVGTNRPRGPAARLGGTDLRLYVAPSVIVPRHCRSAQTFDVAATPDELATLLAELNGSHKFVTILDLISTRTAPKSRSPPIPSYADSWDELVHRGLSIASSTNQEHSRRRRCNLRINTR